MNGKALNDACGGRSGALGASAQPPAPQRAAEVAAATAAGRPRYIEAAGAISEILQ